MAYVTDNELGRGGEYDVGPGWRKELVEFLADTDVMIHDAMYTSGELERHRGWGHSSNLEAIELASEAQVQQLVMFHHRPEHDDDQVDAMLEETQKAARARGGGVDVIAAREGLKITL